MKLIFYICVVLVPVFNTLLNYLTFKAADSSHSYLQALCSGKFITAFMIGTLSILTMLGFYSTGVNAPRGIILMGAISLVIGPFIIMLIEGKFNSLSLVEYALMALIIALLTFKFIKQ